MRVLVLLIAALFAGCSESGPAEPAEQDFGDLDLEADQATGVIRGVVLDESIVPVEGVTVAIQGGQETTTNAEGLFGFGRLDPGTYFLTFSKAGFAEVQQSTEVRAGVAQPPIVKVQLQRIPGTEPYVLAQTYTGWIACEYQYVNLLGSCDADTGVFGDPDSTVYYPIDAQEPDWVQMEITWEHTQEFGKSLTMTMGACADEYCSPYGFGDNNLCQNWGPVILWCKVGQEESTRSGFGSNYLVNETGLGSGSQAGISLDMSADCSACTPPGTPLCGSACGVGLILEQTFDSFLHVFYNFEPDPEWFFLEDGPHPVPDG